MFGFLQLHLGRDQVFESDTGGCRDKVGCQGLLLVGERERGLGEGFKLRQHLRAVIAEQRVCQGVASLLH